MGSGLLCLNVVQSSLTASCRAGREESKGDREERTRSKGNFAHSSKGGSVRGSVWC